MFSKVPRGHGKGNYWRINPDYHELLKESKEFLFFDHDVNGYSNLRTSKLKASYGRKRSHSQSGRNSAQNRRVKGLQRRSTEGEIKTSPSDVCGMPGDLDWISLLGSQRTSSTLYKGSPDLPQVGEPVLCSPLVLPTTIAAVPVELPATPPVMENHGALLEEVVLKQDSPSPQVLLPWAEGNSQSPNISAQSHPWAESKESTMHEVRNLFKVNKSLGNGNSLWSPDHNWSSSASILCRTPLLRGTSIY